MADDKWVTAVGFIQFDPKERDANGKKVIDLVIKTPGGDGTLVYTTIWPEFDLAGLVPEKGDFVAVDGKFSINTYEDKDGVKQSKPQISATALVIQKGLKKAQREVVGGTSSSNVPF